MKSWLPWKYFLRRAARRRGFIDPVSFLARLRQLAQPSEVQEPIELIRAGVLFHARGLINTKILQYNLDWVWPYWVERQFDPDDTSFLPRAFAFSHVNLTHRNWTALGLPDSGQYPIVDPRGLVTPFFDCWSLDWWWIPESGPPLYPSRALRAGQKVDFASGPEVVTRTTLDGTELTTAARVELEHRGQETHRVLRLRATVHARRRGRLFLALRPANPEGASFVERIERHDTGFRIEGKVDVVCSPAPDGTCFSNYKLGDLSARLEHPCGAESTVRCGSGLAAAGCAFAVDSGHRRTVGAGIDLGKAAAEPTGDAETTRELWQAALSGAPALQIPNTKWQQLYASELHTLVLLSPADVLPGPYTYRRFWFRDACLIMHALLALNMNDRVLRALRRFPARQRATGYFHSQEGEWDSNGQVLWIADQCERMGNRLLERPLVHALEKGAWWIVRKRSATRGGNHSGLLPAGFSAEHLGPNDYYYWDDFWGYAGLLAAASIHRRRGEADMAARLEREADAFAADIDASINGIPAAVSREGIPASPYRRMDAGAIGSLVADYPLKLEAFSGDRLERSADWLWKNQLHRGGFFQDMIHSGVNAYLTLALAQTFLRRGDARYLQLIEAVAECASETGNWPEAIHPRTGGGCMGDGQHAWAAAEWILMMRAIFVREERDQLIVGSGIPAAWLETPSRLGFGPTQTCWGTITVQLEWKTGYWIVSVDAKWHGKAPEILVRVPGYEEIELNPANGPATLIPADVSEQRYRQTR